MAKRSDGFSSEMDTKRLEQRMLLYYTQDGLWDLCLGACIVAWGLAIRFDLAAFIGVFCGGAVVLVWALKRVVTHPRAGYARAREDGRLKRQLMIAGVVLLLLGLGAFFLVGGEPGPVVRAYFPVLFGAMVAILLSVIAAWVHQPRFYIYAILIFLAGVAHQWGAVDLWLTVVSAGTAIVASGAVVLLRFLRNNPRIDEGVDA